MGGGGKGKDGARARTPPAEWVVGAFGALLVLATVAFLVHQGVTRAAAPPRLEATVDSVVAAPGGWLAMVTVRNRGASTAAAVVVRAEAAGPGGAPESSEATLDYLPAHGVRHLGLFFAGAPPRQPPRVSARGFVEP